MMRACSVGGAAVAAMLVSACSGTPDHPPAPTVAATPDYRYIIGAGDQLTVFVWRNPEVTQSVVVRPDGRIATPLIDEVMAQGKTPRQLAKDVEEELGKYIVDPRVSILVTGFVGPYSQQIRVVGEAARPQFLSYKQDMTLLDVMIIVGGLTDFADGNKAVIVRTSEGNKQYSVRLRDLIKRGDASANVDVKPGDILIIPQSWF
ncbi:MAG: polysaccharide biosynthesis/export family protein [Rubrivivax sp.]|nr:polysaccharide biosynthesis/export family protein [Rubrivivax sp.]